MSDHSSGTVLAVDRLVPTGPITRRERTILAVVSAVGLAVFLAVLMVVVSAGPVLAHGGPGVIEVGDPESTDDLTIEFPVRITYENDGHTADEVEGLTVRGKGPDGAELAPIDAFVPGDASGVFRATVTLPVEGQWDLTIEVVEPPATATISAEVSGEVTETTSGGDAGSVDTSPDAQDDDAPDDGAITSPGAAPANEDGEGEDAGAGDLDAAVTGGATDDAAAGEAGDDDSGFPWVAAIIAVVLAGAAAVVGFRLATRRNAAGVS